MEKQARHSEWAKLKLVGRPVMTGKAWGASSLLWVAVRPLPRLVHIYHDSKLRDGEALTGTDPRGNTILLTLDNNLIERKGLFCKEIHMSAPSLLLGCMVRESVLWRLTKCKGRGQQIVDPEKSHSTQNTDLVLSSLTDTEKRLDVLVQDLKNIDSLWRKTEFESSDLVDQWMEQAYAVFKHTVDIYRNYRESTESDPFSRFVCQSS